jgi:rubredoxin
MTADVEPDQRVKLGCPQCGYVFTPAKVTACPVCHRARCRCKPPVATIPLALQWSLDPRDVLGYCPDCGVRTLLYHDIDAAVAVARKTTAARDRVRHLTGHKGRITLACGYCRAGHPLGRLRPDEEYR